MAVLDIASTSLVHVSIKNYSDNTGECYSSCIVKISCPNLKVLKYNAPIAKDIIIENVCSVEVVYINFNEVSNPVEEIGALVHRMIKNVPSTSVLKFSMCCIRGLYSIPHEANNAPVTLYKLKSLKLDVGIDEDCIEAMIFLLKHSPNLEVLSLWCDEGFRSENWKLHDSNENILCLESHLRLIQLTGFKYADNEMELLRVFLKNARVLEKLTVVWAWYYNRRDDQDEISKEASEVVLKYPRTSSHVVVTFHDVHPKDFSKRHDIV